LLDAVLGARTLVIAGAEASGKTAVLASWLARVLAGVPLVVVSYWDGMKLPRPFLRLDLWGWALGERNAEELVGFVSPSTLVAVDHADCPSVMALVARLLAAGLRVW